MDTISFSFSKAMAHFWQPESKYVIAVFVALALSMLRLLPAERLRVRNTALLFAFSLLGQFVSAFLGTTDYPRLASMLHEVFVIGSAFALFRLIGLFIFRVLLPRLGVSVVSIAEDITLLLAYGAFILARLHFIGLNPSSLLTTSAVITAVLAFAMQDTLGNMLSGVALNLDDSLQTGDWIRLDDISGQVQEIRWRHTSVRTRNGEIVVIPNSQLMRNRFAVIARARHPEMHSRRWIWFNVTYDSPPSLVIQKVEKVVSTAEIPNLAKHPAPSCVLMEFGPGYGRYALRYWMIDPQPDDPTDSVVRVHVLASLRRAGIELAVPEQSIHVTKENEAYREAMRRREIARGVADLRKVDLFSGMQDAELRKISERLIFAPFARGAVIFEQGEAAHWLYLLAEGEAEAWIDFPGLPRRHFRTIRAGEAFGVRGVLTGEPRHDTVIATTDVVCYRLDQETVEEIIRSRPPIADAIAEILNRHDADLSALHRQCAGDGEAACESPRTGLIDKIRSFLGL